MTADELRALKCSVALSAGELAQAAGLARTTVRRFLSGERDISPQAAARLHEAIDMARCKLMEG